ncbi:MAG TPA: ribonuclease H [Oligoflexia bacterium]|nr:ribonuclease H [Oligoflexia bacterium]HMP26893.1 ribonuclease H [Oligoflexia bacterium]
MKTSEVLTKFSGGPQSGIFTDGGAQPNPGPGGWGVVWVKNGEIIRELSGYEPQTTNNRMELTALIEGFRLAPINEEIEIFSDSELCVKTINLWAASWETRGWKRKTGEIKNLDLIKTLYELKKNRPLIKLSWIKAHNGWLWNEYADALATSWNQNNNE